MRPADVTVLKPFVRVRGPKLAPALREAVARAIHEGYRRTQASSAPSQEPSTAKWDQLPDYLQESNRQQADDIMEKLRQIGCTVRKVTGRDAVLKTFTADEVEAMAEMEHGRWNVERLLNGWKWGKTKDVLNKTSPYLVSWADLPDEVKELDRQAVRNIPKLLASVGLEIRRKPQRKRTAQIPVVVAPPAKEDKAYE